MKKLLLLVFLLLQTFIIHAQWNPDTLLRNIICNHPGNQYEPAICTDGQKGAFISWTDMSFSPTRVCIQHIDSAGYIQWPVNGVSVADTTISGFGPTNSHLVPDMKGGVIVAYTRTAIGGADHIYAQRINKQGQLLWSTPVSIDVSSDARLASATSDEHGGAILNWYRYLSGTQVAVQWIDSSGTPYLQANGLPVVTNNQVHYDSKVAYAGSPSLMMAFAVYSDNDTLRVQAFDTSGALRFATPITLDTSWVRNSGNPGAGYSVSACQGTNKAIIVWESQQGTESECARAQSINANGNLNWASKGIVIDSSANTHYPIVSCSDGARRGAFIAYGQYSFYLQHLSGQGQLLFPPGIHNCATPGISQRDVELSPDGSGGVIAAWQDARGSLGVYGQRYDSLGVTQWRSCGSPVFNAYNVGSANSMKMISRLDGTGIATWLSGINGSSDVFAGKVENVSLTGLDEQSSGKNELIVYPNPASDILNVLINGTVNSGYYSIYDLSGKEILRSVPFTGNSFDIPTSLFGSGVYLLQTLVGGKFNHLLFCVK